MAELLKEMIYNRESVGRLAMDIKKVYKEFLVEEFLESTIDESWGYLELKSRTRKISVNLGKYLLQDYNMALSIIDKVVKNHTGFFGIVFPDFVEVFGQDEENWEASITALENYTPYSTSEFAIRPFIIRDKNRVLQRMYEWSKHENEHIRRLASEGCRPQLPWGQALVDFKKDPTLILPILEQLKEDPSLYVRKSVANNLNDISKTCPDLFTTILKKWHGKNDLTDWILKHGARTLLKKGNAVVLAIFGCNNLTDIKVEDFVLNKKFILRNEIIEFSFSITCDKDAKARLEYGIYFVKANGQRNRKVFKISEVNLEKGIKKTYTKHHSFADLSTRKHYLGLHSISLIVNGVVIEKHDFELKENL